MEQVPWASYIAGVKVASIQHPEKVVDRLVAFQKIVRQMIVDSRQQGGLYEVSRTSSADKIYKIDTEVDPLLEEFCKDWSREMPLILVAEGLEDENGKE